MDFKIMTEYCQENNRWNVALEGEVDIYNFEVLKQGIYKLLDERECDINIRCESLEYIDSTGLGALVGVLKRVNSFNGKLKLINLKPNVLRTFKITALDKVFLIEGDSDE